MNERAVEFEIGTSSEENGDSKTASSGEQVRIHTWNLLSTELARPEYHSFCKEEDLKTSNRWLLIQRTLESEMRCNTILCLQEVNVEWETLLVPFLNRHGYAHYSKTFGGTSLGVMIAWPRHVFQPTLIRCVVMKDEIRKRLAHTHVHTHTHNRDEPRSAMDEVLDSTPSEGVSRPSSQSIIDWGCLFFLRFLRAVYRFGYHLFVNMLYRRMLLEWILSTLLLASLLRILFVMDKKLFMTNGWCTSWCHPHGGHRKPKPNSIIRGLRKTKSILMGFQKTLERSYRSPVQRAMNRPNILVYIQFNLPSGSSLYHQQRDQMTRRGIPNPDAPRSSVEYRDLASLHGLSSRVQVPQLIHRPLYRGEMNHDVPLHTSNSQSMQTRLVPTQSFHGDLRNEIAVATYHMPCAFMDPDVMKIHLDTLFTAVQEWSEPKQLPLLIAGDFNLTPEQDGVFKTTLRKYDLRSMYEMARGIEPPMTCHSRTADSRFLFSKTIDYVLISRQWKTIHSLQDLPKDFNHREVPSLPNHLIPSDHLIIGGTLGL